MPDDAVPQADGQLRAAKTSVLFQDPCDPRRTSNCAMPEYFVDLNLDQVVSAVCAGRACYELDRFYYMPLRNPDEIAYRQEVFLDIERVGLVDRLRAFSESMRIVRKALGSLDEIFSHYHRQGWFLEAALNYIRALNDLYDSIEAADLESRALKSFRSYLRRYVGSESFARLSADARGLKADMDGVRFTTSIKYQTVTVRKFAGEIDYGADIEETFRRFGQGVAKSYLMSFPESSGIDSVQARILERVAMLYPELFARLKVFCEKHDGFIDATVDAFDREINFYLAYLNQIGALRDAGLALCLPSIADKDKAVGARGLFDIALALKVVLSTTPVVTNDFSISGDERIIVVTGPNQGGKTTFARAFGQIHHLACIGCPVPAAEARLFLFDRMFTHFEREESAKSQKGRLHDEIERIHDSIDAATSNSILILNEIFTSTTVLDSLFLSRKIIERIARLDALCVCVTFLYEMASACEKVVSLVCAVDPRDPAIRTFKVERRPADGLAYARALVEKHRLSFEELKARIRR